MTTTLAPLHDRLLVAITGKRQQTKSGLLIPDVAHKNAPFAFGEVLAVGAGRINVEGKTVPLQTKVGDVVCYARQAALQIPIPDEHGGETLMLLIREAECLAIVHGLPRDTGLIDASGAALLALEVPSRSREYPADATLETHESTAKLREVGWDVDEVQDDAAV